MYKVTITPLAYGDLEGIWLYTYNKWPYQQANKYHRELMAGIDKMAEDITLGLQIENVKTGYRRFKINHHYIFYRTTKTHIDAVRILHEKIDAPRHLL